MGLLKGRALNAPGSSGLSCGPLACSTRASVVLVNTVGAGTRMQNRVSSSVSSCSPSALIPANELTLLILINESQRPDRMRWILPGADDTQRVAESSSSETRVNKDQGEFVETASDRCVRESTGG